MKKYKCNLCDHRFSTKHNLKLHLQNIHQSQDERKRYACNICSKSYSHSLSLQVHMNCHNKRKIFKCTICAKSFLSNDGLKYHSAVHKKLKAFECQNCPAKFITKGKLAEHIKQVHENKIRYKCPICQKTYSQKGNLLIHTRRHTNEQKSKCPHCPFMADSKRDLDRHLRVHFADGKYKCSECTASFGTRGQQRCHLRVVHKKDPGVLEPLIYKCSKCPREYKYLTSCKRHELTHDMKKDFKCVKCVAKFYTAVDLKEHMAVHVNASNEFVCRICNAYFYQHKLLSYHNKKWHGLDTTYKNQTFTCQYCIAQFNQKIHMILHQKVHDTESYKYFCQPCNAKFASYLALSNHNRKWHNKKTLSKTTRILKYGCATGDRHEPLPGSKERELCKNSDLKLAHQKTETNQTLYDARSFFSHAFIE